MPSRTLVSDINQYNFIIDYQKCSPHKFSDGPLCFPNSRSLPITLLARFDFDILLLAEVFK